MIKTVNLKNVIGLSVDRYFVREDGVVYSCYKNGKVKEIKPYLTKRGKGYLTISISDNGTINKHYVHRLVAKAFIPNVDDKKEVNHIDGDTLNNTVSNLEWCTHSENIKHAWITGCMANRVLPARRGEDSPSAILTANDVSYIRKIYESGGYTYRRLAQMYAMSYGAIQSIIKNKTWRHI
jgi:hypothetical protein